LLRKIFLGGIRHKWQQLAGGVWVCVEILGVACMCVGVQVSTVLRWTV
jgi:hypothetical protein